MSKQAAPESGWQSLLSRCANEGKEAVIADLQQLLEDGRHTEQGLWANKEKQPLGLLVTIKLRQLEDAIERLQPLTDEDILRELTGRATA